MSLQDEIRVILQTFLTSLVEGYSLKGDFGKRLRSEQDNMLFFPQICSQPLFWNMLSVSTI